ncbi:tyrosine-type recombinase/integrase [Candidatus Berkelbacteria bacterium]|nr:tyrosine-type recombinase/integrase [Candidatus Berkelbacteria bacterium]
MLAKLIREFLEYCEIERGHSQLTIRNYDHYLSRFLEFAEKAGVDAPEKIDLELVRQWRLELNRLEKMSRATQNYHLIALRSFLKYLAKRDIQTLAAEKIELADTPERQVTFLDENEIERLLAAPDLRKPTGTRDKAILEVLFSTGLRVSELANLKRTEINLDSGEFAVRGKGGKVRVVFLSDVAKQWLDRYLKTRGDDDQKVFPITVRQIQRVVDKSARAAGIVKDVHPHTIRHSYATDLLQNGSDLRSVQSLLGHASVTTTQIYTHVTNVQLKEVHKAFHGKRRKI